MCVDEGAYLLTDAVPCKCIFHRKYIAGGMGIFIHLCQNLQRKIKCQYVAQAHTILTKQNYCKMSACSRPIAVA